MIDLNAEDLVDLAAVSPELHARVTRLLDMVLDEAEYVLENGTHEMKQPLVRAMIGVMTRPKAEKNAEDATLAELREYVLNMNRQTVQALRTADPDLINTNETNTDLAVIARTGGV